MNAARIASSFIQGLAAGVAQAAAAPRSPAVLAASSRSSVVALLMETRRGACNQPTPAHIRHHCGWEGTSAPRCGVNHGLEPWTWAPAAVTSTPAKQAIIRLETSGPE